MLGFIIALSIAFSIFFITSTVVCIRRRQKAARNVGHTIEAPVVVTSATHTAPGGYPVTQMPPGTYQVNAYPAPYPAPYPGQANVTVQMPMPNPAYPNQAPGMPPYPTHFQGPPAAAAGTTAGFGAGAANMNPPTYDMAVATQPSIVNYEKQSPYNPSYPQQ